MSLASSLRSGPLLIVSSDLNGTLVHQHTMSDMIRICLGEERFESAWAYFKRQTEGVETMAEVFGAAGPLTKGLTLRQALEYVEREMAFVNGFDELVGFLRGSRIPLIINSTGYSVTIYAIRECFGLHDVLHGQIGNILHFSRGSDTGAPVFPNQHEEGMSWRDSLEGSVRHYFENPANRASPLFDEIRANGDITLGIPDEAAKAELLERYVQEHFPAVPMERVVHIGDTMGDSEGIVGVAEHGGLGIAFNYNDALKQHLVASIEASPDLAGHIAFAEGRKGESVTLGSVVSLIRTHFNV